MKKSFINKLTLALCLPLFLGSCSEKKKKNTEQEIASSNIEMTSEGPSTWAEKLGWPVNKKVIILHADDIGMCPEANTSAKRQLTEGVIQSAAVMIPCPSSQEFINWAKDRPNLDIGLHLTLTSEWKTYRWGTVSNAAEVPGLLDEDKKMWHEVPQVVEHASAEEIEKEIRAQIEQSIAWGHKPTHIDTHMGRFMLPWRVKQNSARIIDEIKPDVIHFQSHIVVGRGLTIEGAQRGIRLVGTNHFMPENLLDHAYIIPKFMRQKAIRMGWDAAGRSFARAESVTTPTRRAAEYLEASTKVRNVVAVSCGIDADGYNGNLEPKPENLIVFLGRLAEEKQIDKVIRALAIMDPALNAKLEIVGGGELEGKLRALATSLGLADRVTLTGFVDQDQLRDSLQRGSVFAMPSTAELQSISTMEAMASGLPVVAANAMALPHLVHDGENGFLFEPGNVEDLAAKLTTVLTMPADELLKFKKESLAIVAAHDIQRTLDTFESMYRGEPVTDPAALGKKNESAS